METPCTRDTQGVCFFTYLFCCFGNNHKLRIYTQNNGASMWTLDLIAIVMLPAVIAWCVHLSQKHHI